MFALWWPLAGSWLLMGVEMPLFAAVVARLPDDQVQLAAFGSLVFPISLLIEAPIIMLLAASTALVRDRIGYDKLWRFANLAGGILTAVHVLVAFTPLFDFVARDLIGVPDVVVEPARIGLRIMTPWTWAISYRRFQQGVLIRYELARPVVVGTLVRLASNATVLFAGLMYGALPGIVVGTAGIAAGVLAEAVFAGICVRRLAHDRLDAEPPAAEPFRWRAFARFYLPLACVPLITIVIQPIGAAAMSRMPEALLSLAAWPAVYGLVFITRSAGFAFNEVVVALVDRPDGRAVLRRFGRVIAVATMAVLALLAATPLGTLWFAEVTGMSPPLAALAAASLAFAVLMPGYAVMQNLYQGMLVRAGRTAAVTEAVVLYLVVCCVCLKIGVTAVDAPGIYVTLVSFTIAGLLQTAWLAWRSRAV